MNAFMDEFESQGFQVLAFPSNNFNLQEPAETGLQLMNGITYVRPGGGYMPKFQMFAKIDVNGDNEHALYTYLKSACGPTGVEFEPALFYTPLRMSDVRWNFEIFLIHKTTGRPIYRYSPDHPLSDIRIDIMKELETEISNEVPIMQEERTNQVEPEVEQPENVPNQVHNSD